MALTLVEAAKLSNDVLQRGVIETFARTSPVLEMIPFMPIAGNSYQYNVEESLPDVAYRNVNEGYVASEGTIAQGSEGLVMLGGDVDVDRFIVKTLGNVNDQRAIRTEMKSKAIAQQFTRDFFKGDVAVNAKAFNGLDVRLTGTDQEIYADGAGSAAATLSLTKLHELLDAVVGGANALFMSKAMRRELQKILAESTHYIQRGTDEFGRVVEMFGDVPIRTMEDDILPFSETVGSTDTCSSIYAVKFGPQQFVSGLTNGGVDVRDLGELDTIPVYRTRIEFYCGLAMFNPKAAARLAGIKRA